MATDDEVEGEPEVIVVSPDIVASEGTTSSEGDGISKKLVGWPMAKTRGAISWFKRISTRDKVIVLLGFLIVMIAITIILIQWGGGGPDVDDGPEIVSNWGTAGLSNVPIGTQEPTLVNLEGQNTPFPVVLDPNPGEVFFVTRITAHVEWTDESTPPAQVPAYGYNTNEPDGFQLTIVLQDGMGELSSPLVYNAQGSSGVIDLTWDLDETVAVADPTDAEYLPEGWIETFRIDFFVYTDECGDWPPPDPWRPNIPDGGNAFDFTWSVEYLYDNDGRP